LNAPEEIMFFRNASIFFAVATLSCSIYRSNSTGKFYSFSLIACVHFASQ
jgi:hypothetical protein